jgi:hypothetical protein
MVVEIVLTIELSLSAKFARKPILSMKSDEKISSLLLSCARMALTIFCDD